MTDVQELIANFVAVTGADTQTAEHYLAANENDLEAAVGLYLETGGASIESQTTAAAASIPAHTSTGVGLSDEEDDAALSRRLQEEEYAARDEVREAIAPRTEVLVDQYSSGASFGGGGVFPSRRRAEVDRPLNAFGDSDEDEDMDVDEEDGYMRASGYRQRRRRSNRHSAASSSDDERVASSGGPSATATSGSGASELSRMFQPPYGLITYIDFDGARDLGASEHKWVLVNIQAVDEFACQILNRDIWSDPRVHDQVSAHFIFLQYNSDSEEGVLFQNFYPFGTCPYIGVVDPRTGELVRSWGGGATSASPAPTNPADFARELTEFLGEYSLDPSKSKQNPVGKVSKRRKDVSLMTEEDQIEYALRQSLGKGSDDEDEESEDNNDLLYDSDAFESFGEDDDEEGLVQMDEHDDSSDHNLSPAPAPSDVFVPAATGTTSSTAPAAPADADADQEELTAEDRFALILPNTSPEPAASEPSTTRIQFRLADGTRQVRRFYLSDPVRQLFAVVKQIAPATRYSYFALTSERKKLGDMMDMTVEEAGLKNSSVLVDVLD